MDSAVPGVNNLTPLIDSTVRLACFSLVEGWEERLLVVLRDGRRLYGILRAYDQFQNLVFDDTIERYYVDLEYAEENLGPFLVRGENVVLVGEIVRAAIGWWSEQRVG